MGSSPFPGWLPLSATCEGCGKGKMQASSSPDKETLGAGTFQKQELSPAYQAGDEQPCTGERCLQRRMRHAVCKHKRFESSESKADTPETGELIPLQGPNPVGQQGKGCPGAGTDHTLVVPHIPRTSALSKREL